MTNQKRGRWFWVVFLLLGVSLVLMLVGQTTAVVDYDLAARLGLQEKPEELTEFGVQVNRAFGAADTVAYIPLMIASMWGLWFRRRWALATTAAFFGVSLYWSALVTFLFLFLPGTPGYSNVPGPEIWFYVGCYMIAGVVGITFIATRGETLLR